MVRRRGDAARAASSRLNADFRPPLPSRGPLYTMSMSARSRLFVALASTVVIGYFVVGSLLGRVFGDTSYGQLAVFNEVVRLVLEAYVEPVNLARAMAGGRPRLPPGAPAHPRRLHTQRPRPDP